MILNNKNFIVIFTVCCLFSFNTWAGGGGLIRLGKEVLGKPRGVPSEILASLTHPTNKHFNRTLDEILETRGISRGDIPGQVINNLREATEDPLKLIDGSLDVNVNRFFGTRVPGDPSFDEHMDLYRAFFQKQLDLSNTEQMKRLSVLVDNLWMRLMPESDDLNTPRYSVLYALTKHSGLSPDEFDIWHASLRTALFNRDKFFKEIAENAFKGGFDEKTFSRYWEDGTFRKFIVDSNFMTKARLTGNYRLLIQWTDELEQHEQGLKQFSALIRSSFEEAQRFYNNGAKTVTVVEDDFWSTATEAALNSDPFYRRFQLSLEEINPDIEMVAFIPNT